MSLKAMKHLIPMVFFLVMFVTDGTSGLHGTAHARDAIVLGVATSLSTLEGRESHRAVQLAVEQINESGGVGVGTTRLPLSIAAVDLKDVNPGVTVSSSLERLDRFLTDHPVDAVLVGFFRSEALLAAMDLIARHRVPFLGTIAMTPASEARIIRSPTYRNIFRLGLNSKYLVEYLIQTMKFLKERFGISRVYILSQDVAWTRTTASLLVKLYFERAQWEVVGLDNIPEGVSDFTENLARARDLGAELILPIFDMPESEDLVHQWNRSGSRALLCGFISPMVGPGAWPASEGCIAGALSVVFELGNVPSTVYEPAMRFSRAYEKRFGRTIEAGHGPAPAYESVYALAEAIERAGTLDPDALVTALEMTDRQGVMGRIRFHQGHQVIFGEDPREEALACVIQWTDDGRRRVVYPPSIADGEIQLPRLFQEHFCPEPAQPSP